MRLALNESATHPLSITSISPNLAARKYRAIFHNILWFSSINEVICHGIPDERPLQDGDILNSKRFMFFFMEMLFRIMFGQREVLL